jgi:hypothetical protein
MTRWQPLPDALPREVRHLVEQLRVLKDRTGLSLAELARHTAYSKSSWQRYLSGAKPPPRGAAQGLGRLAGADQPRLLALWELADQAWVRGTTTPAGQPEVEVETEGVAEPGPVPVALGIGHGTTCRKAALAGAAFLVLLVTLLLRRVLSPACRSTRSSRGRCP